MGHLMPKYVLFSRWDSGFRVSAFMIVFDYTWSHFGEKVGVFFKNTQDVFWFGVFGKVVLGACLVIVLWVSLSKTVTV